MNKIADMRLTAEVNYIKQPNRRVQYLTEYRILLGDQLVGSGKVAGRASEAYLLKNRPNFTANPVGWEMARSCNLL
jgi:hypothetical protein